jgi:hypothetical protein
VSTYNRSFADVLIAKARQDDARMPDTPWHGDSVSGILFGDGNHDDGSIELAHMDGEAKEFDPVAIARTRNNLPAIADQLEAAGDEIPALDRKKKEAERAVAWADAQLRAGPPLVTPGEHMQYRLSLRGIDLATYDLGVGELVELGGLMTRW